MEAQQHSPQGTQRMHEGRPVSDEPYVTDIHYSKQPPYSRANFDGREHVLAGGVWYPRITTAQALEEWKALKGRVAQLEADVSQARVVAGILYGALDDASTVVDKGDDEDYAYQAELEAGAQLLGIQREPARQSG